MSRLGAILAVLAVMACTEEPEAASSWEHLLDDADRCARDIQAATSCLLDAPEGDFYGWCLRCGYSPPEDGMFCDSQLGRAWRGCVLSECELYGTKWETERAGEMTLYQLEAWCGYWHVSDRADMDPPECVGTPEPDATCDQIRTWCEQPEDTWTATPLEE